MMLSDYKVFDRLKLKIGKLVVFKNLRCQGGFPIVQINYYYFFKKNPINLDNLIISPN